MQTFFKRCTFLKFYNKVLQFILFLVVQRYSATLLIIRSSPGQKQSSFGHVMALFDNYKKCAHCHEKGVGDHPCVKKQDCQICKVFTLAQIQQLATPTYKTMKECGEQMKSEDIRSTAPTHCWDGLALKSCLV